MHANVLFEIPDDIAAGLGKGAMERVGGVIRDTSSKQVVAWLRETGTDALDPSKTSSMPGGGYLGFGSQITGLLNLGATVAFGTATLIKLSKIDDRLKSIERSVQRLDWAVDVGFAKTMAALDVLAGYQEAEILADIHAAAELAWSCQFLEPGSFQRINRMENALMTVIKVREKLLNLASTECESAGDLIRQIKRKGNSTFAFKGPVIKAVFRAHQAIGAARLSAAIVSEVDGFSQAQASIENSLIKLRNCSDFLTQHLLAGNADAYSSLLSDVSGPKMSAVRVDHWARKYDKKPNGIADVLDGTNVVLIGKKKSKGLRSFVSSDQPEVTSHTWSVLLGASGTSLSVNRDRADENDRKENLQLATTFCDAIDRFHTDLDRLDGHSAEYAEGDRLNLSTQEYREMLKLNDIPETGELAFLQHAQST